MTESGALSTLRAGRRVGSSGTLVDDHKLPLEQRAKSAVAESPRFVVLDFRRESFSSRTYPAWLYEYVRPYVGPPVTSASLSRSPCMCTCMPML